MNAKRVAVMGAGTMGSGIAAHLANLGFDVLLFDLTRQEAKSGLERASRAKPPHFYGPEALARVQPASATDDLELLTEADWVCEAIIEDASAKRALYADIEEVLPQTAMVTTNTSGLEIALLAEGRSESFVRRFVGTHFFNPPRYLKLIELIPTESTDAEAVSAITRFLEDRVGRRVVTAKDTPGFIANRFGMWCLHQAIHAAERLGFSVEATDAITGPFIGRPKTATFRLADLIGLDIMQDVAQNILNRCVNDPKREALVLPSSMEFLLESGWIGSKAGQGFYMRKGEEFLAFDFLTRGYRPQQPPDLPDMDELSKLPLPERLREALQRPGEIGEFLRSHLAPCLEYAAEIADGISFSVVDFDRVMRWGFGWQLGPFEAIDAIGYDHLQKLWEGAPLRDRSPFYREAMAFSFVAGRHVPISEDPRFAGVASYRTVASGETWAIRDDGRDGFIFEVRSKMNALNPSILAALLEHLAQHPDSRTTLANDGPAFSAGFDLKIFLRAAEEGRLEEVREWLQMLQACSAALGKARSVAALHGYSLGGGLELAMHTRRIVAHPEALLGLPEMVVGVVPAGGGTTLLRQRSQHDVHKMAATAINLSIGAKFIAPEAFKQLFLRESDSLATNPDSLLSAAIEAKIEEAEVFEWLPAPPPLAGMIDAEIEKLRASGNLNEYGASLADEIKHLFVKPKSEQESLEMEVETFLRLLGKPRTQARIKHLLDTGKPLRN